MHTSIATVIALVALGCGGSYPVPTQDLANAQSATRSAAEIGADNQPKAQLHLSLARDQIAQANAAMKDGDNERASSLLVRARADAELAIAMTRNQGAKVQSQSATDQSNAQRTTNVNQQGAAQ
jgi:hypothetical protein